MNKNLIARQSIAINAPVSKIWEALIKPELIRQYFFGSEIVTDWKEGHPIIYKGNYQGKTFEDKGKVVKIEPEKLLVVTHWSPLSGTADSPENYHTVTYELAAAKGGNQVTITQDKSASEAEQQESEQLWGKVLENLKQLLEQ